ncbi:hypothetical protein [Sphingomonas sp. BK235]|uniref:hypothetical protein n=1 Tax=Sphingomonas sp. BK235 TaxID=2512131 RepID=UPI0010ED55A3|nr:hypothetical protein [Sphingomonas sp. BK235]TCP34362.1 hypothetical protein EV292_104354 [Sphingomonas sp. BK235]
MSAAQARAALAAIGRDLSPPRGTRRLSTPTARPSVRWEELALAPDWLRAGEATRARLAQRVALFALADELARSIDGAWLGALAEVAGAEAVDQAIARGGTGLPQCAWIAPAALTDLGLTILRRALPPGLRALGDAARDVPLALAAPEARRLVAEAQR